MNDLLTAAGIPAYVQRVINEHAELVDRISKLDVFLTSDAFHAISLRQQFLLNKQIVAMQEYAWLLNERIKEFRK